MNRRRAINLLFAVVCTALAVRAQDDQPATNLEIFRTLASAAGDSIAQTFGGPDSVRLEVRPQDIAWLIEGTLVQTLARSGIVSVRESGTSLAVGIHDIGVTYSNMRGSAIFGGKDVDRSVTLRLEAMVTPVAGGISSREYMLHADDTVPASAIPSLENRAIPATMGLVPEQGFFANLAEPLILIGALAVGVYLLFSVRS